jgi:hypothetical protein
VSIFSVEFFILGWHDIYDSHHKLNGQVLNIFLYFVANVSHLLKINVLITQADVGLKQPLYVLRKCHPEKECLTPFPLTVTKYVNKNELA